MNRKKLDMLPMPANDLIALALRVEQACADIQPDLVDLLASAYKYRKELAGLEKRDGVTNDGAADGTWQAFIKFEEELAQEDGQGIDEGYLTETTCKLIDGCYALSQAAQGKSWGGHAQDWMLSRLTQGDKEQIVLRENKSEIQRAFIEVLTQYASYIAEHCLSMARNYDSDKSEEKLALEQHGGMTLSGHLGMLVHRLIKLGEISSEYDDSMCLVDEEENEPGEYEGWLQRELFPELSSKRIRDVVAKMMKQQRKSLNIARLNDAHFEAKHANHVKIKKL